MTYEFLNDVYLELLNLLAAAGLSPATATPTQVLQAIRILMAGSPSFGSGFAQNNGNSVSTGYAETVSVKKTFLIFAISGSPTGVLAPLTPVVLSTNGTVVNQGVAGAQSSANLFAEVSVPAGTAFSATLAANSTASGTLSVTFLIFGFPVP